MKLSWTKILKSASFALLALSLTLFLGACGGGGGGGGGGTTSSGGAYDGSATVSGKVSLSSLVGEDQQAVSKAAGYKPGMARGKGFAAYSSAEINSIIKVYVVGSDGELEDTGKTCSITGYDEPSGNPEYECTGLKDGVNYIIRFIKILADNQAIDIKVDVEVPSGSTTVTAAAASPATTIIVETLVDAILSATEGADISQDVVNSIIDAVKAAIVALVDSGAITVPSVVVEAPQTDTDGDGIKDTYVTDASQLNSGATYDENEGVENASGIILSDDTVTSEIDAIKTETAVNSLAGIDLTTNAGKKELITRIFTELIDDGEKEEGPPEWMIDFFARSYIAGTYVTDVDTILNSAKMDLGFVDFSTIDPATQEYEIFPLTFSNQSAIDELNLILDAAYTALDHKAAGTMDDTDKQVLADIPPLVLGLFPKATYQGVGIQLADTFDIPWTLTLAIYAADHYAVKLVEERYGLTENTAATGGGGNGGGSVDYDSPVQFEPFGYYTGVGQYPSLFQLAGMYDASTLSWIATLPPSLEHSEIRPEIWWMEDPANPGMYGKYDSLEVSVCMADPAGFVNAMMNISTAAKDYSGYTATLTYPTAAGTGSITLFDQDLLDWGGGGDMGGHCWGWHPYHEEQINGQISSIAGLHGDFVSGNYTVTIANGGTPLVATINKKVIKGMGNVAAKLSSPASYPQWPGSQCDQYSFGTISTDPGFIRECENWYIDQGSYQSTIFPINVDTSGNGTVGAEDTEASITVFWTNPTVTLPEGVKIAYNLDIGQSFGNISTEQGWIWDYQPVYNTYQQDKLLYGTSFKVPVNLALNEVADQHPYSLNLCAEFVDKLTGKRLGRGGCSWSEFYVGQPLVMSNTFDITIKAPGARPESQAFGSYTNVGDWKAAIVAETWTPDNPATPDVWEETWAQTVVAFVDITGTSAYDVTISPTIGNFLDESDVNNTWLQGTNKPWYNIVIWEDKDGDGEIDVDNPVTLEPENEGEWVQWPPYVEGAYSNINFNTWGGMLRIGKDTQDASGNYHYEEQIITGSETVAGPDFSPLDLDCWFNPAGAGCGPG